MNFLILLVVIVGIIAIAQLAKVSDLSASLSGRREEDISQADTRLIGGLFMVFWAAFLVATVYLYTEFGSVLPQAASLHGADIDSLFTFNWWIITIVFVLVNSLLFYFCWKYAYDPTRKASFFAHDNRLELIWTVIPSIVLAVIIIYGLRTWAALTDAASDDALRVELYSKQFDWTARYVGADGEFGQANYNFVTSSNPLGIITEDGRSEVLATIQEKADKIELSLAHEMGLLQAERASLVASITSEGHGAHGHDAHGDDAHDHDAHGDDAHDHDAHADDAHDHDAHADDAHDHDAHGDDAHDHDAHGDHAHDHDAHGDDAHGHDAHDDHADGHDAHDENAWEDLANHRIAEIDHLLAEGGDDLLVWTDAKIEAQQDKLHRLSRHRQRVMAVQGFDFEGALNAWETGKDDHVVKGEFHLPVGREVEFVFRSRDVIHSAYMPHFRAQMNTVPGVPTRFKMTPTITTDSMRTILNDPEFNYVLLCNKICGAAHFNMKMDVVVDSEAGYEAWLNDQETFVSAEEPDMQN